MANIASRILKLYILDDLHVVYFNAIKDDHYTLYVKSSAFK